jgi:hypothetical protein
MGKADNYTVQLLGELVSCLIRNYPDEQWDATTRELIEQAAKHLGSPDIDWPIEPAILN